MILIKKLNICNIINKHKIKSQTFLGLAFIDNSI